jgi:zinc transport system permease protein
MFHDFFSYEFVVRGLVAGVLVAAACASIGAFLVQRGASMMGDALGHLAFSGIALGLVANVYPFGAALVLAILGSLGIRALQKRGIVLSDTAVAVFFTLGLSLGILIMAASGRFNVNIHGYLFGSLATVTRRDLAFVVTTCIIVLAVVIALFKEFVAITLDEDGARVAGLPVERLNAVFAVCTAIAIVVSTRVVGSLLVSALVVLPAIAATQIVRGMVRVTLVAVLIGSLCVAVGFWIAFYRALPTGPLVAALSGATFAVSLLVVKVGARVTKKA